MFATGRKALWRGQEPLVHSATTEPLMNMSIALPIHVHVRNCGLLSLFPLLASLLISILPGFMSLSATSNKTHILHVCLGILFNLLAT
jgi:hypothetical protein